MPRSVVYDANDRGGGVDTARADHVAVGICAGDGRTQRHTRAEHPHRGCGARGHSSRRSALPRPTVTALALILATELLPLNRLDGLILFDHLQAPVFNTLTGVWAGSS